jgi:hypothetical protein
MTRPLKGEAMEVDIRTVTSGADPDIGAKADVAATTDTGTSSLISLFKRLLTKTPVLGAASAAASMPVTLANDGVFAVNHGLATDSAAGSDTGTFSHISLFKRLLQRFVVDSTDRIRVSLYGKASAAGDTALLMTTSGRVVVAAGNSTGSFGNDNVLTNPTGLLDQNEAHKHLAIASFLYNGVGWDRRRAPNVFKVVALGAATAEATIWTPTTGKKFRLMGFLLTCGAASTLTFKDNTAGTTIFVARGTTDTPIMAAGMGNGILSAAANNVLTVTRGTSCTLDGVVWGTEE